MSSVKKDFYKLGQSEKMVLKGLGEEIRIDLNLLPNENLHGGIITGVVKNPDGTPNSGAIIKIMGNDYTPLAHTISGEDGSYTFPLFKAGTGYRIFASAMGFKLCTLEQFSLLEDQSVTKDFDLLVDASLTKSFIAGDIFDKQQKPVLGSNVNLYLVKDKVETLVASTFTNEYGQYVFRELEVGDYKIKITGLGYLSATAAVTISKDASIAKIVSNLQVDELSSRGTISGIITDDKGQPIMDADVVLYRVESDDSLTPIALTKTITGGVYLFVNTDQGNYRIKSSKTWIDA